MTDKQIIIDGVDVSGCEAIDNHNGWCSFWEENCAKNPDCIHKKYLRKEQECEEWKLKATSLDYADEICALEIDLKHKEQECEELKKSILLQCPNCGEEYLNYKGVELYDENSQLKQALTEIKEIAKTCISGISCTECPYTEKCKTEAEALGVCKMVLKKCEVLDE